MIHRQAIDLITEDLALFPVIGIVGPRQVGKTTLARTLQAQLSGPSVYLDLELPSDLARLEDPQIFLAAQAGACVVIDEVQRRPDLFPLLRALVDQDRRPGRFVLLGSASPALLRNSAESLAGRIAYHELTPFSLSEIMPTHTMQQHWVFGGFPGALLAPSPRASVRWLDQFIATFIERDMQQLADVSPATLSRLLTMVGHIHGNLLNVSDLSRSLGVSLPTVNRYLDLLEGGFMLNRLQPWFVNVGKRLVKSPKVYIRDSGVLHRLARINDFGTLHSHPLVGASWEGYVVEQVRRTLGNEWEYYFYRTHAGAEADLLLLAPNGKRYCAEIKYSLSPSLSKGFHQAMGDLQPTASFLVMPEGQPTQRPGGVTACGLGEFLLAVQE